MSEFAKDDKPDDARQIAASSLFPDQPELFRPRWANHWVDMPEFDQKDLMPWQTLKVHFRNVADRIAFAELLGQSVTDLTRSVWYPEAKIRRRDADSHAETRQPRYPIYIVSKGRWESRLTSRALEQIRVPYRIVIEPQEYDAYSAVISPDKILTLPFSNLGQGSIPARNWIWEHALASGAARHWCVDDNIRSFMRLHENKKLSVTDGSTFAACEDFTDRYTNVALSGMNYQWFAKQKQLIPPFITNTRIYSCILIRNDISYRWRGKYNEDTDLSLRVLKDGLCTIQFNAFLADKQTTMTMRGGNTDELYKGDGRREMAESLLAQHPDVVKITRKFNRWQHHVNYAVFKRNKLILRPDLIEESAPCETTTG